MVYTVRWCRGSSINRSSLPGPLFQWIHLRAMASDTLRLTSEFNNTLGAYAICMMFLYTWVFMDRSLGLTETIFHRLYGTILAQVVHYFRRYNGDRTTIKNMVRTDITDTILIRLICALGIFSVVSRLTLVRTLNASFLPIWKFYTFNAYVPDNIFSLRTTRGSSWRPCHYLEGHLVCIHLPIEGVRHWSMIQ